MTKAISVALCVLALRLILLQKCRCSSLEQTYALYNTSTLPKAATPLHYALELDFNNADSKIYTGTVQIDLQINGYRSQPKRERLLGCLITNSKDFRKPREFKRNNLVLHANERIKVKAAKYIQIIPHGSEREISIKKFTLDRLNKFVVFDLAKNLVPRTYGKLIVDFAGELSERDMSGIYVDKERSGDRIISSSFLPAAARKAFPCFDEPEYKATFALTVLHKQHETVLSNAPEDNRPDVPTRTTFRKTKPIPVHMLGLAVGSFGYIERHSVGRNRITVRLYTQRGLQDKAQFALDVACKSIEYMEEYTDFPYPLEKFDIVSLPNRDKDIAAHWGMAVVQSNLSLHDNETREDQKIVVAVNVAQVVAQQWFGNLINVRQWDDVWLTEGISGQKAFEIVQKLFPELQSDYFIRLSTLSNMLHIDSKTSGGMHPLAPPTWQLQTSEQISNLFDTLQLMKSASLLQLIQNKLGYERLRGSLRILLNKNAYGTIDRNDFANAIEVATGERNFLPKFSPQIGRSSYPIIHVELNGRQLNLRYAKVSAFELGLSVEFGDSTGTREISNIDTQMASVDLPEWFDSGNPDHYLKLNPNADISTFFYVKYADSILRNNLKNAIENKRLSPMDRLNVLEDAIGLVLTLDIDDKMFAELLSYYKNEDHGAVILAMLGANRIALRIKAQATTPEPIMDIFLGVYKHHGFETPKDRGLIEVRSQMATLKFLIEIGNEEVITEALKKFDANDGLVPETQLREPIYSAVVAHGTTEQRAKMLDHLRETRSFEEQVRLVKALIDIESPEVSKTLEEWVQNASDLPRGMKRSLIGQIRAA